mgnify:CR=1 FL=1
MEQYFSGAFFGSLSAIIIQASSAFMERTKFEIKGF